MASGEIFTIESFIVYWYTVYLIAKYRRLRWAGHIARMEEGKNVFKVLTGEPIGKSPLESRRRLDDNIRMGIKVMRLSLRNCVDSAQNKDYWITLVNSTLNLRVS